MSLQNVAELVERLRLCADDKSVHCKGCEFMDTENNLCMNIMINCAADAIEALLAENAKLKAERDAAVEDLFGNCCACAYEEHLNFYGEEPCQNCDGIKCEWRGVREDNT